jgi:hypothetical protein
MELSHAWMIGISLDIHVPIFDESMHAYEDAFLFHMSYTFYFLELLHRQLYGFLSSGAYCSQRLCDNDPGVMGATLCPHYDLILEDPNSYKDLVVSFVNILKQVAERRLLTSYDYHQMPAPFIQVFELC